MSRRAINYMNNVYPDATTEELHSGDNVCIICREEMTTAAKKLPCNHIFHTACLRSWFQVRFFIVPSVYKVLNIFFLETTDMSNMSFGYSTNTRQTHSSAATSSTGSHTSAASTSACPWKSIYGRRSTSATTCFPASHRRSSRDCQINCNDKGPELEWFQESHLVDHFPNSIWLLECYLPSCHICPLVSMT